MLECILLVGKLWLTDPKQTFMYQIEDIVSLDSSSKYPDDPNIVLMTLDQPGPNGLRISTMYYSKEDIVEAMESCSDLTSAY